MAPRGRCATTPGCGPAVTGPAQIHYSTADGRDLVWMVGQRRIFQGQWTVENTSDSSGQQITQICLRYPGVNFGGLSATPPAVRPAPSSARCSSARAATPCR